MKFNLHERVKDLITPLLITILCIVIASSGTSISDVLRYDSEALQAGEIWRLVTPHFLHLSWSHLAMNMGGLFLVFLFFSRCVTWQYWLSAFLVSSVGISVLIFYFNPEIRWYVGLSGILHTLFVLGGLADILVRKWEGIMFTLLITAKIIYEQNIGPLPGSEESAGGPVLVDAHMYGAIFGALIGLFFLYKNRKKRTIFY